MKLCKKQKFLSSRLQRPGMRSSLKKLLADCFKTPSGRPEDWTVSGSCHLLLRGMGIDYERITLNAGPAGGPCLQLKTLIFGEPGNCTTEWRGGLKKGGGY